MPVRFFSRFARSRSARFSFLATVSILCLSAFCGSAHAQTAGGAISPLGAVNDESLVRLAALQKLGVVRVGATFNGAQVQKIFPATGWALVKWQNATTKLANGLVVKSSALQTTQRAQTAFGAANALPNNRIKLAATPDDPAYSQQWWPEKIGAPAAWDVQNSAETPIIAVLDTGVQFNHPELRENLWVNTREIAGNGVDDDTNGYVDDVHGASTVNNPTDGEIDISGSPNDTNGHGTHITGILAARGNNGREVCGALWRARIMPVRFIGRSGFGTDAAILGALDYVIALKQRGENIRITSNSWETPTSNAAVSAAFDQLGNLGVLSICAAGNGDVFGVGRDLDVPANATYPASYPSPAIIAVAASTQTDAPALFSNYGLQTVDIAAPGVNIFSTSLTPAGATLSGTSQAAPLVVGAAGLLWEKYPTLSAAQVKEQLLKSVVKTPQWQTRVASGGRLDMSALFASLRTSSRLAGVVQRSQNGTLVPIQGARVQLGELVTFTDSSGAYVFPTIGASTQTLSATFPGFSFESSSLTFGLPGTDVTANLVGTATGPLYSVSGRASNSSGIGLSGVSVLIAGNPAPVAQTNANGEYSVVIGAGNFEFTARKDVETFIATPSVVRIPDPGNGAQTNFTVNFSLPLVAGSGPLFTAAQAPSGGNGAASFTLSDADGVDRMFCQLSRTVGGTRQFYNWSSGVWVSDIGDAATVSNQDLSGQNPTVSRSLPALSGGSYVLKAWARDDRGNETPIGGETFVRWTV